MSKDNPLVAVTLWFKDGAALRQVFTPPVPQSKAMATLGRTVAELGGELNIQLEPIPKTEPTNIKYLILKILHQVGPLKTSDITKSIPFPYKSVWTKLLELEKEKRVKRDARDLWSLT